MEQIIASIKSMGGAAMAVLVVSGFYILAQRFLSAQFPDGSRFVSVRRIVLAVILFVGALVILMALPIDNALRGQILSFIGIIVSAAFALSSTTLLGNAMAALMMRFVNDFQVGDFIKTKDIFGKVIRRGILHTEIQTEDRNLQTIPNLYLATNPVKVIRPSGTIISGSVTLGYDVQRLVAEEALLRAARQTGLKNPFVFITSLGDFSVEYQIHGLLEDVNSLLSTRSKLNKAMLDKLHGAGIEIVSPTFMNQRVVTEQVFIPEKSNLREKDEGQAEKMIFDKADLAERLEKAQLEVTEVDQKIKELEEQLKKNDGDINLKKELYKLAAIREKLLNRLETEKEKNKEE